MIASCLLVVGLSACGNGSDGLLGDSTAMAAESDTVAAPSSVPAKVELASNSVSTVTDAGQVSDIQASNAVSANVSWMEVANSDMRTSGTAYALNDDKLLHRNSASYSSQSERAVLMMGRYGTSQAFTSANPDYAKELSYISMSNPVRQLAAWPRLVLWDQIYLGERFGANHAPGYTGNSRVRTWGYEMWIKSKSGSWRRIFKTDTKGGEAWRPTFRGSMSREPYAFDLRKESDGSTSARPLPAVGLDSSGTYWVPHGYAGGIQSVDPYDVADILVLCYSQLIMHDQKGVDDRRQARYLFAVGADWYPPSGLTGLDYYPGVGTSRHKYVTIEPQLHVMHTMTEAELRANPPPR